MSRPPADGYSAFPVDAYQLSSTNASGPQPCYEERRIANDGRAYTWHEFCAHYGDRSWQAWTYASPLVSIEASEVDLQPPGLMPSAGTVHLPRTAVPLPTYAPQPGIHRMHLPVQPVHASSLPPPAPAADASQLAVVPSHDQVQSAKAALPPPPTPPVEAHQVGVGQVHHQVQPVPRSATKIKYTSMYCSKGPPVDASQLNVRAWLDPVQPRKAPSPPPPAPVDAPQPPPPPPAPVDAPQLNVQQLQPQVAAPVDYWRQTPFFVQHLPQQHQALNTAQVEYARAVTARDAINLAYQLYPFLPLSDVALTDGSLKQMLCVNDALFVAAERISCVMDHNRPPYHRVDLFVYMPSGEVHRYHPGQTTKQDAQTQVIRLDSTTCFLDIAVHTGVGDALHRRPPDWVRTAGAPQPGQYAVTPAQLVTISKYDVQAYSHRYLLQCMTLRYVAGGDIDITSGAAFPWWLGLATVTALQEVVRDGILEVRLVDYYGAPALVVRNSHERVRVTVQGGLTVEKLD